MTIDAITLLIAEAKVKHLFLYSPDHPGVYLTPSGAERVGVEKLASADNYPHGWALIDAKEIAFKHRENVI